MRQALVRYAVSGAAIAAVLAIASPSFAEVVTYKADLKGSSEVPPNTTAGSGTVTVKYDTATKQITWDGTYSGLTGPATAAHLHGPAEPGKNAGVMVPITPATSPLHGSATLTDAQATALTGGEMYVNVHTDANKGGELRGQLTKM
jgi:hypothetical protein